MLLKPCLVDGDAISEVFGRSGGADTVYSGLSSELSILEGAQDGRHRLAHHHRRVGHRDILGGDTDIQEPLDDLELVAMAVKPSAPGERSQDVQATGEEVSDCGVHGVVPYVEVSETQNPVASKGEERPPES